MSPTLLCTSSGSLPSQSFVHQAAVGLIFITLILSTAVPSQPHRVRVNASDGCASHGIHIVFAVQRCTDYFGGHIWKCVVQLGIGTIPTAGCKRFLQHTDSHKHYVYK